MKLWRDLEVGEKKEVGDRCCGYQYKWFVMTKEHISEPFDKVSKTTYPMQREVKQADKVIDLSAKLDQAIGMLNCQKRMELLDLWAKEGMK